jgi:hypothetical protein
MLFASTLLCGGVAGCGGANKAMPSASRATPNNAVIGGESTTTTSNATSSPSTKTPSGDGHKDSNDGDNDPGSNDDNTILDYGHAASGAEKQAITTLVTRYYLAAASDDGAMVCSLIYGIIVETIPENYGQPSGLGGKSCAVVMSNVFLQRHQQVSADADALKVTRVRIDGKKGLALLYLGMMPESHIYLHREGGVWKVESLFAAGMP